MRSYIVTLNNGERIRICIVVLRDFPRNERQAVLKALPITERQKVKQVQRALTSKIL